EVGTQGTKGLLVDTAGRVVARAHKNYGLIPGLPAGAAEQHPDTWVDAVRAVSKELLAAAATDPKSVRGVGVAGQQHGLVVLDAHGEVVRPAKLWCDTTTAAEARELTQRFGRPVPTGFTASKILWLIRHEPESWQRTRRILLPHDYINWRLCGQAFMEAGDASGTGLLDAESRSFRMQDVRALDPGLADLLPPLTAPQDPGGQLSPGGADLLGLPEGVVVAVGGGDNMMSAIGSGATEAGIAVLSLGTSGTVFTRTDRPMIDPKGWIAPFCSSDGGWLPLLCVMNLTGVTEEVVQGFGLGASDHEALGQQAAKVPAGCDGLLWLPYLQGERVPDLPEATGTLLGMRAQSLRAPILYRAAMEGTSLNLAVGFGHMQQLGFSCNELRLAGGAAQNPLWRQILADCLGTPIRCLREPESAALGAALQAMWVVRRQEGEGLALADLTRRCVSVAAQTTAPGPDRPRYQELLAVFREWLLRLHDVG
ncbi:MAG: xylulokinase, partial [Planctomycetota bacterium]